MVNLKESVACPSCSASVALAAIIPDLLLSDLPSDYTFSRAQLEFDLEEDLLGYGAEGVVYKAVMDGVQTVALKQSVLMRVVDHKNAPNASSGSSSSDSSGALTINLKSRV
jgi:hypothetical protein